LLLKIDVKNVLAYKLNTILVNHVNDFLNTASTIDELKNFKENTNESRLKLQEQLYKSIMKSIHKIDSNGQEDLTSGLGHIALLSRKHELAYLRQACKKMLPLLLPDSVYKCK
jgi:hypothetical protein